MWGVLLDFKRLIPISQELSLIKGLEWLYVIVLPILIIFIISFYIGYERQNVGKAAGVSSHVLVGLASVSIAIMQRLMFAYLTSIGKADGSGGQRVIAQVVTGVSFIGAGVVMKNDKTIKGLTTAATIWSIAALGLVIGSGYLILGSIVGGFIMLFITIRDLTRKINPFKPGEERINQVIKYSLNAKKNSEKINLVKEETKEENNDR